MAVSRTLSLDAFLTATAWAVKDGIKDNVFDSTAVLSYLKSKKRVKERISGGESISYGIMTGKNPNAGSYDPYEILPTAASDGMTRAYDRWSHQSFQVVISGPEIDMNSGKAAIVDLQKEKTKQGVWTMNEDLNKQLMELATCHASPYTPGGNNKDLISIPFLVSTDTTNIKPGNVNPAVDTVWVPQETDSAAASYAAWLKEIRHMLNLCSNGMYGGPDFAVSDMLTYEMTEAALREQHRYTSEGKAKIAFDSLALDKNCDLFWDKHTPDAKTGVNWDSASWAKGTMYTMNSNCLYLAYLKGKDFAPGKYIEMPNQDAFVCKHIGRLQLYTDARRKHGVIHDIDTGLAA